MIFEVIYGILIKEILQKLWGYLFMVNKADFIKAKRNALEKYFGRMNDMQQKAVFTVNGPVLILAGAGSGKTTVLVNRIANMIHFGNTYNSEHFPSETSENDLKYLKDFAEGKETDIQLLKDIISDNSNINPWNILAITFTKKAAGELKERLTSMLGDEGKNINAATFHSACAMILRREIEHLGYNSNFTIYDTDDSKRVIKACMDDMNISDKQFPAKTVMSVISRAKDSLITPQDFTEAAGGDYMKTVIAKVYTSYQSRLFSANALDFDDIIRLTVELFEKFPDVLEHYQNLYKYIMVDEYQDTNSAQYKLISLLSSKHENLCVVGDDDQSIYRFRGATIENILNFEDEFKNCTTIRLEQNYRSTQNILSAANSVIKNNTSRKAKQLWTESGNGEKITQYKSSDEFAEARFAADTILSDIKKGKKYSDHAVLYRTNAQSNTFERAFVASGIPYKVVGGMKFYDRKEIKDITAYLSVINNYSDMLRLKRIINEPKRGIGDATVSMLEEISMDLKQSPLEIMREADQYPPLSKKAAVLKETAKMFDDLKTALETVSLEDLLDMIMEKTGYTKAMVALGEEGLGKLENINELKSTMIDYEKRAEEPSLSGFLEEIALYTDVDSMNENNDNVLMMTMHSAKGLEFPIVFLVGMEEGIFPGERSKYSQDDIEEERRLAYVAITRAKEKLYISTASQRMLFGQTNRNLTSRFVKEIDKDLIEKIDSTVTKTNVTEAPTSKKSSSISLQKQMEQFKSSSKHETGANQNFAVGDRISHNTFGEGIIVSIKKMANDSMVEIAFDKVGTKKIMANFARIKKI